MEQKIIMKMIKKRFKKQAKDKYRNLSKEEKDNHIIWKKKI